MEHYTKGIRETIEENDTKTTKDYEKKTVVEKICHNPKSILRFKLHWENLSSLWILHVRLTVHTNKTDVLLSEKPQLRKVHETSPYRGFVLQ